MDRLALKLDVLMAELRVPVAELRIEDDEPALPMSETTCGSRAIAGSV